MEVRSSDIELKNRCCSVHIADADARGGLGSGLLYYPGSGDRLYVFTCAHVIKGYRKIEIDILDPVNTEEDDYNVVRLVAPVSQAVYSPLEVVEEDRPDVAVIALRRDENLRLEKTAYRLGEPERDTAVLTLGFPGGWRYNKENLLMALDTMEGRIRTVPKGSPIFDFRVGDAFLDNGNRIDELGGFSGAPVWSNPEEVVGLVSSAARQTGFRGRVNATKMRYIWSIMKNSFNIVLEMGLNGIPEEDVAAGQELLFDAALPQIGNDTNEVWLTEQLPVMRAYIDDLKIQKAMELGEGLLADDRYPVCQKGTKLLLMRHLAYCYDICGFHRKGEDLEYRMIQEGLIAEHDADRWMQKLFMDQRYDELLAYAATIDERDEASEWASLFKSMGEAFVLHKPPEETVGQYIDENERLRISVKDADTEAFYLQIIGYVYDQCYRIYEKAIRCMNRAYRISAKPIILENLGASYYQLAIRDAIDKERIVLERINRSHLYKARTCFLELLEKEEEPCLREAVRRIGWQMFHTFSYLQDMRGVLEVFPLLSKWFVFKTSVDRREVEIQYANVLTMSGNIDFSEFSALTDNDKLFFRLGSRFNDTMSHFVGLTPGRYVDPELEEELCILIKETKSVLRKFEGDMAMSLYRCLVILYSKGIQLFGWRSQEAVREYATHFKGIGNKALAVEIEDMVFRCDHSYEECRNYFKGLFRENPTHQNWCRLFETLKFFGNLNEADRWFQNLLYNHRELYVGEPEFAIRGYLDFIKEYKLDAGSAIKCFLKGKDYFEDKSIEKFWESELMLVTTTLNGPGRFEEIRCPFVEKGLVPAENNDRDILYVYVLNLERDKADEVFERIPKGMQLSESEIFYIVWRKGAMPPFNEKWNGIVPEKIENTLSKYRSLDYPSKSERAKTAERLALDRVCCLDAWTLYLLAENDMLEELDRMDRVYIPHITVRHILDELRSCPNMALRAALDYISDCGNVTIRSADFEHQLSVRERVKYDEPACVVALAMEVDGIAVISDPCSDEKLLKSFPSEIVFSTDIFELE